MRKILGYLVLALVLSGALIVYWNYYNVFSDGERKGVLIKITKKGNIFKTWEGEMWLSCRQMVNPEKFLFSIQDKGLADSLENLQDQCIQVKYSQYRKTIPWRGDSEYIITGFTKSSQ
ncbi:MAG: hypothetical protein KGO82_11840 [Bacteroidota bacterium]|nr:hypothetical protein [Bacteroidota bacterium]